MHIRYALSSVLILALSLALVYPAEAQDLPLDEEIPLPGVESYDDDIPKPEDVIGHQIGERHTESLQTVNYFEAVTEASDIAFMEEYARSYQNRPLIYSVVTSEENHERLDEIREANVQLTENPDAVSDEELEDMPAVVYMGYSVHGDEASGTEAGILLLYHLTAGQGEAVDEMLEDLVVIIDPNMNPDGRDRFVNWVNMNRGTEHTTDVQDREHTQPWPGGRTNHFWFDLNRDYFPLAHPESQGKIETYQHWRPQVFTDFHEMGRDATYFFQPGVPERTHPLTPEINQELTMDIAEYHADRLDEVSEMYWTRETFDDFYYGKGSTYPDVQGTVGILFEQNSSRSLETETEHGPLHYRRAVRNQFATTLSTLEASVDLREDLLRYQRDFYAAAPERFEEYDTKAYVIDKATNRTQAQALADNLQQHRVRVHELDQTFEQDGHTFSAGDAYIVPMNQPQNQYIEGMMETRTTFPDSIFYDVSTWTLPKAYGTEYAELEQDPGPFVGSEVEEFGFDGGEFIGERRSNVGYVMEWSRYFAPRALYELQDSDMLTKVLHEPMTIPLDGQEHDVDRGAILIPADQPDADIEEVHDLVQELPAEHHVRVFGLDRGLMPERPDFGTPSADVLEKPRVAALTGSGTSMYNVGEVWHLLNERYDIPVSLVDVDQVSGADMDEYNTLVLAGGFYGDLDADQIQEWVRDGGTLVGIESGAEWINEHGMTDLEEHSLDLDSLFIDRDYADLTDSFGAQNIGGSIFEVNLDTTHPVAYGYSSPAPVLRGTNTFYSQSDTPGANVASYTEDPLLSGYLSEERGELVPERASIVAESEGSGEVILMFDNPNFRAFWWGTNGLFANALFFGQTL